MPSPSARDVRRGGKWSRLLFPVLAVGLVMSSGRLMSSCGAANELALDRLRTCRQAQVLLGDNIDVALGPGCGSLEDGPGGSHASAWVSVAGDRSRGRYSYNAHVIGGISQFSGTLEVGDVTLGMHECDVIEDPLTP